MARSSTSHETLELKAQADGGNAATQFEYANRIAKGRGVARSARESARYYKMAADHNYAAAQLECAMCLDDGRGVARNEHEFARYYKLAADQSDAEGQWAFGQCLKFGRGVPKDVSGALKYFERAVAGGLSPAREEANQCRQLLHDSSAAAPGPSQLPAPNRMDFMSTMRPVNQEAMDAPDLAASPALSPQQGRLSALIISLADYPKLELINSGAFGDVWRTVDTRTGGPLALKVMKPTALNEEGIRTFEREVEILASTQHETLLGLRGYSPMDGPSGDPPAILMDFISGGSL
jgi:TPR repeat protein